MAKQDPLDALKHEAKGAAVLGDKEALSALLHSEEARTLARLFQQMGGDGLKQAAEAAAAGEGAALGELLNKVRADPEGARAMEAMRKKTGK